MIYHRDMIDNVSLIVRQPQQGDIFIDPDHIGGILILAKVKRILKAALSLEIIQRIIIQHGLLCLLRRKNNRADSA